MQKATSDITILHFFLPISAYISEAHHTSITSRFCVHGTFQINQMEVCREKQRRGFLKDLVISR